MTASIKCGPRNLITDVGGLKIGNAQDHDVLSGVSVILPDEPAVAGVHIAGGAPATRETDALDPTCLVDVIHAIVLSGGSVFGLDAASGVTSWLAQQGRGFSFREQPQVSPIVPAACLFDITNGGNKQWGDTPPYRSLGIAACEAASKDFTLGNMGAGLGATSGIYKGGLGSASAISADLGGVTVGALAAVNSFGSPVIPGSNAFWAAPFEIESEFGNMQASPAKGGVAGLDPLSNTKAAHDKSSANAGQNTTLCVVATDAILTPTEAKRIAIMASDGMARALRPVHTPFDGDIVFVVSTGRLSLAGAKPLSLATLGTIAADTTARAIARGVYEAETLDGMTSYRDTHTRKSK